MNKIFQRCFLYCASATVLGAADVSATLSKEDTAVAQPAPDCQLLRHDPPSSVRMSGGMTDPTWDKIPVFDKFIPAFKDSKPLVNTSSARIFYNADAIYVGFDFSEKDMKRIKLGLPPGQTDDVPINSNDDCAEILIWNPFLKNKVRYHLRVVPSGAKDDARYGEQGGRDQSWNGKWEIRTRQLADRWQGEVRIPLSIFAEAEKGWMCGTLVPKDLMKLNIGRVCSTVGEFSHIAPRPGGFHNQTLLFQPTGFRFGNIWLEQPGCQRLKNGENALSYQIMNDVKRPANIKLTAVLIEEEPDPEKRAEQQRKAAWKRPIRTTKLKEETLTLEPGKPVPLNLNFNLTYGGKKTVQVQIDWLRMKSSLYKGTLHDDVYDLKEAEKKIEQRIESSREKLTQCRLVPVDNPALKEASTLLKKTEQLYEKARKAASLSEREQASKETARTLDKLEYLISVKLTPYQWAKQNLKKEPSFSLGIVQSGEKVFRHKPFCGKCQGQISLSMAGNEFKSAQFVLFFLNEKAGSIKCSVSDFKGPDGAVIPASNCFFNPVGYVNIHAGTTQNPDDYWPDVLYPGNEVIQGKHPLQPVMFTIKADENQRPGNYTGTVSFSNGTDTLSVNTAVKVFPFSLPKTRSFRMNIWFHASRVIAWYKQFPLSEPLFSQIMELCGKYNFAMTPRWQSLYHTPVQEKDGKYIFDFSRLKAYYDIAVRNGANCINFEPVEADKFQKIPLILGPDGKKQKLSGDPEKIADEYFLQLLKFFKDNGYDKYALLQVGDEPWSQEQQEKIRIAVNHYRTLSREIPPIITAGTNRKHSNLEGYIDYWCPQFNSFDPKNYRDLAANEQLWFYQCLYKPDYPAYQIDRPGADARIAGFMSWKYNAKGFLYWTCEQWAGGSYATPENKKKLANRWIHEEWGFPIKNHPGDGCFIYPTKDGVIASFRAQQIRESVDDYEYMAILKKQYEKAKTMKRLTPELAKKAEKFLQIPDNIVKMTNTWTKSLSEMDNFRDEVGNLTAELIALCAK